MNILIICGGGASSGFLAQSMRKAAKQQGEEVSVLARSESELEDYVENVDVVLIGPHLKYMEEEITKKASKHDVKVAMIDQLIYGTLDGAKALDLAKSL